MPRLEIWAYPHKVWITLCISVVLHASRAVVEAFHSNWSKNSHGINSFKINNLFVKQKRNTGPWTEFRVIGAELLTLCTSCGKGRCQWREDGVQGAAGNGCRAGSAGYHSRR